LRRRANQRIVLEMRRSHDPTDPAFRDASTAKQRHIILRERDELRTAKEVRSIMVRLLNSGSRNPHLYAMYARLLMELAAEVSNHKYMLKQPYVDQLALLAGGIGQSVEAQAYGLRGLRLLATATGEYAIDDIRSKLASHFKLIPLLMSAASVSHEDTRVEVCRLVCVLATQRDIARRIAEAAQAPPPLPPSRASSERAALAATGTADVMADEAELAEVLQEPQHRPIPFLAVIGMLLATPSARLQIEACLALEPFCVEHKVAMCQAKVVGALISLTQSHDPHVVTAASRVLTSLH